MKPVLERKDPLVAPLARNGRVGTLKMMVDGKPLLALPVVALEEVSEASIFGRAWDSISWLRPSTMKACCKLVTLLIWPLLGALAHCSTWKVMPGSRLATSIRAGSSASVRNRLSSSIEVMRLWSILASGSTLSLVVRKCPMK
jgi:hypothetical protein